MRCSRNPNPTHHDHASEIQNFFPRPKTMSISNTAQVPTLSGGLIDMPMITRTTDETIRRTKIICTIGPACWNVDQLETLMDAGMDVGKFLRCNKVEIFPTSVCLTFSSFFSPLDSTFQLFSRRSQRPWCHSRTTSDSGKK